MSLFTLPQEVLEMLFLYVEVEDLLRVWRVVDFEGSDIFWRKICKREGYKNISTEDSWKSAFYLNINWKTQKYVKREYEFNENVSSLLINSSNPLVKDSLYGEILTIQSSKNEISVWNVDKYPVLVQQLPAEHFIISGTKLITYNKQNLKIYSCIDNTYYELLNLEERYSMDTDDSFTISDKYFAVTNMSSKNIKIVNIEKNESYILSTSPFRPIYITILGNILHTKVWVETHCILKRHDLEKREGLEDINLYHEDDLYYEFKLEVSSDLLVNWAKGFPCPFIPPLTVWKSNGEFLKSITFEFIRSFEIQRHIHSEEILWLIVEGEYIIFSIYETHFHIWSSKDPDICEQMYDCQPFHCGQKVISSHLLVLSYRYCFKVVDFKKAIYLYEVWSDNNPDINLSSPWIYQGYFINDYFYVHLQRHISTYRPQTKTAKNTDECHKEGDSSCTQLPKAFILTIYDFRHQAIQNL